MKAYEVHSCNLDGFTIWSGKVIARDDESVSDALKRKFGLEYLECEEFYGREVNANEINPNIISVKNLTVGELMIILEETFKAH